MSEEQKKILQQKLWDIANTLRGKMTADDFRDYILGFIFYKYLSEKIERFIDMELLSQDDFNFVDIDESMQNHDNILKDLQKDTVEELGYFLKPNELFSFIAKKGNKESKEGSNFILDDLESILKNIESSTMGTGSQDDYENLFEDLDLSSSKLGRSENAKNELIAKVLAHLDEIDFKLRDSKADVLGDAYEYLIAKFASGAGKTAGEFYTPQMVSTLLAKLVTSKRKKIATVYDPTCGSGSLLLRVAKELPKEEHPKFYGQELTRTTYNLARMNMILHDVHYCDFDIKNEDTLEQPQHMDKTFEAIVANPPFSAHWSARELFLSDDRFSQYGKLAPRTKADFAFVQHMLHHLAENGTMAVVLPHGVLFRGAAEGVIRKYIIEERNYIDAVIGLPANIFFGTSIPTSILVFKKCRENPDDILFIDASGKENFEKVKAQNFLRDCDIEKIIRTYKSRKTIDKYSYKASLDEVRENEYNLNIPRYVDTFEEEEPIDLDEVTEYLSVIDNFSKENDKVLFEYCNELELPKPIGNNIFLIEEYKKGVMQKIFSQEIRFKANDGSEYAPWEKKRLGNIAIFLKGKGISKTDIVENGSLECIRYGELYTVYDERILHVISKTNLNKKDLILSKSNDVIIPASGETQIDIATASCVLKDNVALSGDLNIIRTNENGVFLSYYLNNAKKIEIARLAQGISVVHLYSSQLKQLKLNLPSIQEQTKIANFLSAIDEKLLHVKTKLEKTKEFKKALLQQMFV